MTNFEDISLNHSEAWQSMQENMGNPEQLKTTVNIEALREACADNPVLARFFESMLEHFYGYTETVWDFQEIENKKMSGELSGQEYREAQNGVDMTRTRSHDGMIASVNILARAMKKAGLDATWIMALKDATGQDIRTKFTVLALKITYLHIIQAMQEQGKEGVEV